MTWRAIPLLFVLCLACSDGTGETDAGNIDTGVAVLDSGDPFDAGKDDAGETEPDAGMTIDAGLQCGCVPATLHWELDGGFRAYHSSSEVQDCRTFVYTRTILSSGVMTSCTNELPCQGDLTTIADLNAALAEADVVAAFEAAPILYGRDERASDGALFVITLGSATVSIGFDCGGAGGCIEIPPGVAALRDLLANLDGERLEEETCASTF